MYYKKIEKEKIVDDFKSTVSNACGGVMQKYFIADHIEGGYVENIKQEFKRLNSFMKTLVPKGIKIDSPKLRLTLVGETVTVTIRNSEADSALKYKFVKQFTKRSNSTNESMFLEYADWLYDLYEVLLVSAMAQKNVDAVNEVLDEICRTAEIPYSVKVIIPFGQGGKRLAYLSDDEIVYCADIDKIFELEDLAVMSEPGELLSEDDILEAKNKIAQEYSTAHTVFEFVKAKGFGLISYLCGKTAKGVMSQIKEVTTKNIVSHSRRVDGLAYYSQDDVYALAKFEGGEVEVVLSPFNIKTLEPVEGVDVVGVAKPKKEEE